MLVNNALVTTSVSFRALFGFDSIRFCLHFLHACQAGEVGGVWGGGCGAVFFLRAKWAVVVAQSGL